jgi:hypothetical protein
MFPIVPTFVSDFRQVPDNQEAFVDGSGDSSIIIELMEAIETNDLLAVCVSVR